MNNDKELTRLLMEYRENNKIHEKPKIENNFYHLIASGDIEAVRPMAGVPEDVHMYEKEGFGRLSSDPIRNLRYHFVTGVAMITRHCVEKGLDREMAYTISDMYINKMDKLNTLEDILKLHGEMIMDYTTKMAALPKQKIFSLHVVDVMNYVSQNLNREITVDSVAEHFKINRSYLSKLFVKEAGLPLSEYIRNEKIKAAANLIRFSDYSYLTISEYLCFSSQSHFISCFKKQMGMTPAQYRKMMANEHPVY